MAANNRYSAISFAAILYGIVAAVAVLGILLIGRSTAQSRYRPGVPPLTYPPDPDPRPVVFTATADDITAEQYGQVGEILQRHHAKIWHEVEQAMQDKVITYPEFEQLLDRDRELQIIRKKEQLRYSLDRVVF